MRTGTRQSTLTALVILVVLTGTLGAQEEQAKTPQQVVRIPCLVLFGSGDD